MDSWKKLQHSNVVQLREVFTTKSFNDQCKTVRSFLYSLLNESLSFSPCVSLRLLSRLTNTDVKIFFTARRNERLLGSIPGRCETIQVNRIWAKLIRQWIMRLRLTCSHKSNLQRTQTGPLLHETEIWAIIMQLTAGLRAIHQAGLACRYVFLWLWCAVPV